MNRWGVLFLAAHRAGLITQVGVQVGLPMIGVLLLAVVTSTAGPYFIYLTSGVTPKQFVGGEW